MDRTSYCEIVMDSAQFNVMMRFDDGTNRFAQRFNESVSAEFQLDSKTLMSATPFTQTEVKKCFDLVTTIYHEYNVRKNLLWHEMAMRMIEFCEIVGMEAIKKIDIIQYYHDLLIVYKDAQYQLRSVRELRIECAGNKVKFEEEIKKHKEPLVGTGASLKYDQNGPQSQQH